MSILHELGHYYAYMDDNDNHGEERAYRYGWITIKKFNLKKLISFLDWYNHHSLLTKDDIKELINEVGEDRANDYLFLRKKRFKYFFHFLYARCQGICSFFTV
jgi:hypothetical protein